MLSSALRVSYILEEASQQVEGLIPVPTWRMAKWERAIAAVCLYMADDMPKGLENALLHSLRALSWLGYPLPWSSQYEKETKGWKAVVRNARKWSYGFVAGRQHLFGDELDAKAVAAEVAVLGAINTEPEPEERAWEAVDLHTISVNFLPGPGGVSADVEREGIAALRLLGAAVLSLPNPDKPSVEYVLWTCRQFCRGKVPQSHPLRDTYVRMKAALGKARPSARASLVALRTFQATMSAAHRTGETILQGLVSNASSGVQQRRSSFAAIREER